MAIKWSFNKLRNLITHNTSPKLASYLANDEFEFITYSKKTTDKEKNTEFLAKLDNSIKQYDEESARCNKKIIEAQAKYSFLNSKKTSQEAVKNKLDTLGISKIKYTDFLDKFDDSEKVTNAHENKSFFSSFSLPLNKVYDFGAKSFGIIKNATSILSSKITETFNFVNNKALSYFGIKAEETFENLSDDQLVEEIINTPEEELDAIFEKMTYEKLAELINNVSDEQAKELINYIMPWHIEKVIELISPDKLIEQELKKLSNENIFDEQIKDIIISAGEEKLAGNLDIIPNENLERIIDGISNDKLVTIINNASNKNLEKIVDNISDQNLPMILHLLPTEKVKQIMILIHGEEAVKQLENQQLLEEIINTPDNELDEIKTTKLIELMSDISDENLERIIDGISNDKLAVIINNASDKNLERIVDSIPDQNLSKVLSEISSLLPEEKFKQIMVLICGEESIKQLENQTEEEYNSSYHENFVNSGSSVGLLGNSEKTGYNSDDSGIENDFDPNDNWVEYF